jgi:hypothetical protein
MNRKSQGGLWPLVLLLGTQLHCAGHSAEQAKAAAGQVQVPQWVIAGTHAGFVQGRAAFVGFGQVSGIKNTLLRRSTAENRARAELALLFESYSAQLLQAYSASAAGRNRLPEANELDWAEQAVKAFSAASFASVRITDQTDDSSTLSASAQARLELSDFIDSLGRIPTVAEPLRQFVREQGLAQHAALVHAQASVPLRTQP